MLTQLINFSGALSHKWHTHLLKILIFLIRKQDNWELDNFESNLVDFCLPYSAGKTPSQDHHVSPRSGNMPIRTPSICAFSFTMVFHMAIWIEQKMYCCLHFLLLGPILKDLAKRHGMSWIGESQNAKFQIMLKQNYWERSQRAGDCQHTSICTVCWVR